MCIRDSNQVRGLPFTSQELTDVIMAELAQLGEEVPA